MAPDTLPFQTIRVVSSDKTLRITLSEYAISLVIDGHVFFFVARLDRFVPCTTTATYAPGHNGEADTPAECMRCVGFLARAGGQL